MRSSRFSRPGARQHLHLRAALDLEDAGGLGGADRFEGLAVVERRSARGRAARPASGSTSSTQRSTAESIPSPSRSIFRKPASAQESLSHWTIWRPSIAAGTTGQTSISGCGRDHHAARSAGRRGGAGPSPRRQSQSSACQRGAAARSAPIAATTSRSISPLRLVEADRLRHLLDLLRRQPQRLAEVAHDAARAVGREGGDQGRAVGAVALVHARDQHLADVAGEVEVDVGHRAPSTSSLRKRPEKRFCLDRVDVGEAGQVADDRADAGAAAAARRQHRAGRVAAAHLDARPRGPARAGRGGGGRSRRGRGGGSSPAPARAGASASAAPGRPA